MKKTLSRAWHAVLVFFLVSPFARTKWEKQADGREIAVTSFPVFK